MREAVKTSYKTLALALIKLPAMAGGHFALAFALAASLLMFFTAHFALNAKAPSALELVYVDNDDTDLSKEFISLIKSANGASVMLTQCADAEQAKAVLESGGAEGLLIIRPGLDESLASGSAAFEYLPARGASSAQAARELIAGEAVTLGSRLRAAGYFEALSGREPTADELKKLEAVYSVRRSGEGSSVEKTTVFADPAAAGKPRETELFSAFFARYSGFASFVIMLVLLMLGAFCGSRDERRALERISALKFGRVMSFFSTFFALLLFGLLLLALSFIPSGTGGAWGVASGSAYVFCACALSMLLGSLSGSARAELASPLVAFLTALAGGCFTDPTALGGGFKTLSRFTPQGQYLAALNGETAYIAVLFALGTALLILSRLLPRAANRAYHTH